MTSIGARGKNGVDFVQPVRTLKNWLSHGSDAPSIVLSTFFKNFPTDKKMWLRQTPQELTSLDDLKQKDLFQGISNEPSLWLCSQSNRKLLTCQEGYNEANFFSHISKDNKHWLQDQSKTQSIGRNDDLANSNDKKSSVATKSCCKISCTTDVEDSWLSTSTAKMAVLQLKDICRANELCGDMSECVSQPDCCTQWFQEKSSVKNAMIPVQAFKLLSTQEWLSPDSRNQKFVTAKNDQNTGNLLNNVRETDDSFWLMKPTLSSATSVSTTPLPVVKFKDNKEESNLSLQKTGSTSLPDTSPPIEGIRSSSTSSPLNVSDWLMVTPEDAHRPEKVLDHDKESEGWSVCSDSHSANTDQYTKDIAAADEYFTKWLL